MDLAGKNGWESRFKENISSNFERSYMSPYDNMGPSTGLEAVTCLCGPWFGSQTHFQDHKKLCYLSGECTEIPHI